VTLIDQHAPTLAAQPFEEFFLVSCQYASTTLYPVRAIGRVIPLRSHDFGAGTPCIPGDVLHAVGQEGVEPGPGAAVMQVPQRQLLVFICSALLSPRAWQLYPLFTLEHSQVGGVSAIVATLFGHVERTASRVGVTVTRSSAPNAIVPQVGCIVICRSVRCSRLFSQTSAFLFGDHISTRRVARVVQAKATAEIFEVDRRPIAATFQVC
jgi:hypothetical protein